MKKCYNLNHREIGNRISAMQEDNFNTDTIEEANSWLIEYKKTEDEAVKKKLKDLIVLSYMPLVKKVARGFARRSTDPVEDITQVGSMV